MSTYLQLVNNLKRELGVAGDELATIENQVAMKNKLVNWIADADIFIQSKHWDWNFLWSQYSQALTVGDPTPIIPSDLSVWDRDSFFLDYSTNANRHLSEILYPVWRRNRRQGVKTNRKPSNYTIYPSGQIHVVQPPDSTYTLTADYWKTPTKMTDDASTSDIPVEFERIIVVQAKLWYAEEQEFPLLIQTAKNELNGGGPDNEIGLLRSLESHQLPNQEGRNMGSGIDITVVPE